MDYLISRRLSSDRLYAYYKSRFWFWDEERCIWRESHLMSQRFEREHNARHTLTPERFMTDLTKFQQLDEFELDSNMLDALKSAKPCKAAPIEPVEEDVPTTCICSTCTCGGCKEECFGNCHNCGHPVQECNSYQTEGEKYMAPPSADVAEPFSNAPTPSTFDFSALGDLSGQAAEADQQFDLHYGTAQDEYLISCIYAAQMHALTAKAGRYGGGTWTKWYESKGMSKSSVWNMVQTGEGFKGSTVEQLNQLPAMTRKDLNLIARSGCAEQLTAAAGDSQRVQELLAQLKAKDDTIAAEKERADTAEHQLEAAQADVAGLKEQNGQLKERVDAAESREEEAWKMQSKAEARAKTAEDALKRQPIAAVVDEEEIDRLAAEKAWGLADARNAELQSEKDKLEKQLKAVNKQLAQMRSQFNDNVQANFEIANNIPVQFWTAWNNGKGSYSHLTGEDLESTFQSICSALNDIREEASLLCRQPADYDGGADEEPDV